MKKSKNKSLSKILARMAKDGDIETVAEIIEEMIEPEGAAPAEVGDEETEAAEDPTAVVETPEASLDAAFIDRAGHMLGEFSASNPNNVLVASSNLNQTHMIPVLFGVFRDHEKEMLTTRNTHFVQADERESRIINLLRLANATAALQIMAEQYAEEFAQAVYAEERSPDMMEQNHRSSDDD